MNKVMKDPPFAIMYLDDIIIYTKMADDHLAISNRFYTTLECKPVHET